MAPPKKPADFTQSTELALVRRDLDGILAQVMEIKADIKAQYSPRSELELLRQSVTAAHQRLTLLEEDKISKDQFAPVKLIVYGAVGIILTSVIGALLAIVISRGNV